MPEIGRTLSHFKIVEKIGEGGMGTVFLAEDLTLDRKVALKFLPDAFTSDPDRMARFEREAKLLASLNHPNIAGIYGLEQADGNRFLVLEYVEGETLQAKLSKGALPLEDALDLCRQIAEGLEAAHEKGVIHRDLKPANVMITAEEKVKILDFGLAKAFASEQSDLNLSNSPTLSVAATQQGIILGTAGYMSPEQARGKSVDRRADIWAFGVILYEMLTGSQLFKGETVSDTMASVLTQEPDFDKVPIKVRPLLKRCLAKDPKLRLRDIGDTMSLLEFTPEIESTSPSTKANRIAWGVAILAVVVAVTSLIFALNRNKQGGNKLRCLQINYPDGVTQDIVGAFAVSPDGNLLAFWGTNPENTMLYLRPLDSFKAQPLANTEISTAAGDIFWSSDGSFITFYADNQLKTVNVSSREVLKICDISGWTLGGSWNSNGVILYGDAATNSIMRKAVNTSEKPKIVAAPSQDNGENRFSYPVFLPDGNHFLYLCSSDDPEIAGVYVDKLEPEPEEKGHTLVLNTPTRFTYVPSEDSDSGYLITLQDQDIVAREFNLKTLKASGEFTTLAQEVGNYSDYGYFSASNDVLVYKGIIQKQFAWLGRDGVPLEKVGDPGNYSTFDLSEDASKLVVAKSESSTRQNLWIIDTLGEDPPKQLTFEDVSDSDPRWNSKEEYIIFDSIKNYSFRNPYQVSISQRNPEQLYECDEDGFALDDVSPDGQYIIYHYSGGLELWSLSLAGEQKQKLVTSVKSGGIDQAQFSPNGRLIAFQTNESDQYEVKVVPFSPTGEERTISIGKGSQPTWGKNGNELYFIALDGNLMVADIIAGKEFRKENVRRLFQTGFTNIADIELYAPDPSGERFLILKPTEKNEIYSFNVIDDWTKSLKQ